MSALTFTSGATVVTLAAGRRYPIYDPVSHNVVVNYSEGGQAYCYDKGVTEKFFHLDFYHLGAADHAALADFHQNVVVGPRESFTFTDESGADHTVRWMDNKYPLKEVSMGLYSGTITLRKEIA